MIVQPSLPAVAAGGSEHPENSTRVLYIEMSLQGVIGNRESRRMAHFLCHLTIFSHISNKKAITTCKLLQILPHGTFKSSFKYIFAVGKHVSTLSVSSVIISQ